VRPPSRDGEMRLNGDSLFAAGVFAIFSFGTYQAMIMKDPKGGPADVGAAFFPFWVCVFIQILTVIIFIQSLRNNDKSSPSEVSGARRFLLLTGILLLLFLYIFIMDSIGFIISSILFLVAVHQLLILFETGKLSPLKGLGFSVLFFSAVSIILYFMFNTVFRLALP
ncbi:MAG: tripartite tricarboxylate transporter TctB family protein, partial [Desulfocapsaceae bacterium]